VDSKKFAKVVCHVRVNVSYIAAIVIVFFSLYSLYNCCVEFASLYYTQVGMHGNPRFEVGIYLHVNAHSVLLVNIVVTKMHIGVNTKI